MSYEVVRRKSDRIKDCWGRYMWQRLYCFSSRSIQSSEYHTVFIKKLIYLKQRLGLEHSRRRNDCASWFAEQIYYIQIHILPFSTGKVLLLSLFHGFQFSFNFCKYPTICNLDTMIHWECQHVSHLHNATYCNSKMQTYKKICIIVIIKFCFATCEIKLVI